MLCGELNAQPPTSFAKAHMEEARARLKELPGQGPFEMCVKLHQHAWKDLVWLGQRDVLGMGSVVMYGKSLQAPVVLLRPEVNVNLGVGQWTRELTYITTDYKYLQPKLIGDVLVKTQWPMRSLPDFAYQGPQSPWYLKTQELLQQAAAWGIAAKAGDSHDRVRQLVMAKAIVEYEQQHSAAVEAAWQAASAQCSDQTPSLASTVVEKAVETREDEKAMEARAPLMEKDDNPTQDEKTEETTGATDAGEPPTEKDDNATQDEATQDAAPMAAQRAQSTPRPGQPVLEPWLQMENKALAGLPEKPRCGRCNSRMVDGQCVYPDCKEQDGIAQ